jgi:alpha-tubulin suppressor-like RCC1 family protein
LTAVPVSGLSGVTQMSASVDFACGLLASGTVESWGDNAWGELGTGSATGPELCADGFFHNPCSTTPVPVSGLSGVTAIAAGGENACALLGSGGVDCWGINDHGQLGDGTNTGQPCGNGTPCEPHPVAVSGISGAVAITVGNSHACALLASGSVECWGEGQTGMLGDGNDVDRFVPVQVSGLSGATAVTAGFLNTCALLQTGAAECWGDNSDGQIGDGTAIRRLTPVPVTGLPGATAVSEGSETTCAVLSSGGVDCWGGGQLGEFPSGDHNLTPVPVAGIP